MAPEKIKEVCALYRKRFEAEGIIKKRMPIDKFPLTKGEMLAHAYYLLDGIEVLADDPEKKGKTGRHLDSVQTILWAAGWYTQDDLMKHNRPDQGGFLYLILIFD